MTSRQGDAPSLPLSLKPPSLPPSPPSLPPLPPSLSLSPSLPPSLTRRQADRQHDVILRNVGGSF